MVSFANDSIIIKRPSTTTSRGTTVYDYTNTTDTTVTGCSVQPATTSIDRDGRVQALTDGLTAYIPIGTDVEPQDLVGYEGLDYKQSGDPRKWKSPTGAVSSIILNLVRYTG